MGDVVRPLIVIAAVETIGVFSTMVAGLVSGLRAGDALGFVLSGAAVYGLFTAGLVIVVLGLMRRRGWARGPFVVVQMFTLVVALYLVQLGGALRWIGVGLAMLGAVGLFLALRPAARAALR